MTNGSSSPTCRLYARITAQIVAAIEAGAGEYRMPWHCSDPSVARPTNVASGKAYRGVNRLVLWIAAQSGCHPSGLWGTYRHWQALGAQVRKGERATTVVFWKEIGSARSQDDDQDENERGRRFLARGYSVFNRAQVDNYEAEAPAPLPEAERIGHADALYSNLGITTIDGGSEAYFLPSSDRIHMPSFEAFEDPAAYYSVLYHEATHATAAAHRVGRDRNCSRLLAGLLRVGANGMVDGGLAA